MSKGNTVGIRFALPVRHERKKSAGIRAALFNLSRRCRRDRAVVEDHRKPGVRQSHRRIEV